jgi:phosphatidyl-myo-inositol alpha-mannosyltransferase
VRSRIPNAVLRMVTQDAPARLPEGVEVLGRLSEAELADEYRRAWVFCLPSTYEGFGVPYAEAMTAALPVVATPNVGARFVTDEGRFGVLAPIESLGDRLADVLVDERLRTRLGEDGLARSAHFDMGRVVDEYERLYRGVPV